MKKIFFIFIFINIFNSSYINAEIIDPVTTDSDTACIVLKKWDQNIQYNIDDCIYNDAGEVRKVIQDFISNGDDSWFYADSLTVSNSVIDTSNPQEKLDVPFFELSTSKERSNDPYTNYFSDLALVQQDYLDGIITIEEFITIEEDMYNSFENMDPELFSVAFEKNINQNQAKSQVEGNDAEKKLCISPNAGRCLEARSLADYAEKRTNDNWLLYTTWQGNGDAYRHALWNALMVKNIGSDFAYKMGLAHEGLQVGYNYDSQSADTKMDLHNNRFGREYYQDRVNMSLSDYDISYHMYYQIKNNSKSISSAIRPRRIRVHTNDYKTQSSCNNADTGTFYYWGTNYGYCTKWTGWYVDTSSGGGKH